MNLLKWEHSHAWPCVFSRNLKMEFCAVSLRPLNDGKNQNDHCWDAYFLRVFFSKICLMFSKGNQTNKTRGRTQAELDISVLQLASDDVWQAPVPPWPPLPAGQECYKGSLSLLILLNDNQKQARHHWNQLAVNRSNTGDTWMCNVSRGAQGSLRVQGKCVSSLPSMVTALVHAFDVLVLHGCWEEHNPVCECHTRPVSSFRWAELRNEAAGEKRAWRNERELVASLHLSAVLFCRLSNLSPDHKFYVLFRDRATSTRWLRLHACLSSSALLSKELMIAVILDEYDDSFLILTLHLNLFIFPHHCFWIIYLTLSCNAYTCQWKLHFYLKYIDI